MSLEVGGSGSHCRLRIGFPSEVQLVPPHCLRQVWRFVWKVRGLVLAEARNRRPQPKEAQLSAGRCWGARGGRGPVQPHNQVGGTGRQRVGSF